MKAAIITSSDSGYAGEREDKKWLGNPGKFWKRNYYEVKHTILLPDDKKMLADEMARITDEGTVSDCNYGWNRFSPRPYAGGNKGYYRT